MVTPGCDRPWCCEHLCSVCFVSLLSEPFRNMSSQDPSLSCLNKSIRDWKHDSGGYFLGSACTKALFLFLLQYSFLLERHLKNTTLLMYSVFFHALAEQIILSHKVPASAHRSITAAEEQTRGVGRGWEVQAHPGKQELSCDAAFEFHAPFGVT